ncbi:Uma2 family endonuclease [Enhygromyxa salina]|uniref:Putative restriction endonuclease domain-containing protein n=1 Tax=Enhygromyxa salina TaxID=215803 RepID=A0A2S9YFV0_9BACT|nr:Uma2 family endonuclease [Enhygromyxa salina]PRQ03921.1 hypothetical protein ENSA7_52120 [Enhygromyxa salina]
MTGAASQVRVSYAEYLRQEQLELHKHQWIDGEVYAMVGGTPEHARIQARLIRLIGNAVEGGQCQVFTSDLRIRSRATNIATYADITVVCGPLQRDPEDRDAATNPKLVIEVLSPTTERFDRGDKALHYRRIASVSEYVLVAQDAARIEVFRRSEDGSWRFLEAGPGESVRFESIGCTIAVDDVYAG